MNKYPNMKAGDIRFVKREQIVMVEAYEPSDDFANSPQFRDVIIAELETLVAKPDVAANVKKVLH